jgi:hypothetical protein
MVRWLIRLEKHILNWDRNAEINDFGYPQNSEIDTLKTYITTESIVSSAIAVVSLLFTASSLQSSIMSPLRRNPPKSRLKQQALQTGGVRM